MLSTTPSDPLRQAIIHALHCADAVENTLVSALLEHCLALLDNPPTPN